MIEVLCGTIASGKGTYAKQQAKNGWIIVNDDNIINLIHSNQYSLYSKSLKPLYKSIENHIVNFAIGMGKNVVIDRGVNVRRQSRQRWIALAHSLDVPIVCVVFPTESSAIHAWRRYNSDRRGCSFDYWLRVAEAHIKEYEKPVIEEGFDEVFYWNEL